MLARQPVAGSVGLNLGGQQVVEFSTALTFVLAAILAAFLTQNYLQRRSKSYLFWSIGLWLFALSVFEEYLFSAGYYGESLIRSYLGLSALLVEFLALGSIQLVKSSRVRTVYYVFCVASTVALSYFLGTETIGNILDNYVVYGTIPLSIITVSSIITFPAVIVLIVIAAFGYRRTKSPKMLSIIAGVVVTAIAGSLYTVQFPAFLYYSEFIGILLLWLGFFDFPSRNRKSEATAKAV
jgi:MFS family permease